MCVQRLADQYLSSSASKNDDDDDEQQQKDEVSRLPFKKCSREKSSLWREGQLFENVPLSTTRLPYTPPRQTVTRAQTQNLLPDVQFACLIPKCMLHAKAMHIV